MTSNCRKKKEAIAKYEQAVNMQQAEVETLMELAQLVENDSPTTALKYYEKALNQLKEINSPNINIAEVELRNNIGVMKTLIGKPDEAKEDIKQAIKLLIEEHKKAPTSRTCALHITLHYNLAYAYEMLGSLAEANGLYKKILKDNPNYIDANIRLSILALQRGNIARAIEYAETAGKSNPDKKSHTCECYLANLYIKIRENQKALEIFSSISAASGKRDTYALVGGASLLLASYQQEAHSEENIKAALKDFASAIELEEKNVYAAVGIANCLALLAKPAEAIQAYKLINESAPDVSPAVTNMARVMILEGMREDAISVYRKYLEKFVKKDEAIELELASAYFQEHMHDKSLSIIKKLMFRNPGNPVLRYNAGLCLEAEVIQVLSKKMRRLLETQEAIRKIKIAIQLFDEAKHADQTVASIVTTNKFQKEAREEQRKAIRNIFKKADDHSYCCEDMLKNSRDYLERDQRIEKEMQARRDEQERKRLEEIAAQKRAEKVNTVTEAEEQEIQEKLQN